MALPNLKSKLLEIPMPKSRHSIGASSSRPKASYFNLQRSVEVLENMDLPKTPRHVKSLSLQFAVSKEFNFIEQDLDSKEIMMLTSTMSSEQQYRVYMKYLESLANLLKFRDEKLSKMMARGIVGCDKAVGKGFLRENVEDSQIFIRERVAKKNFGVEIETQTSLVEDFTVEPADTTDPEYYSIQHLPKSLKKIQISKISSQLYNVYESLRNMETEIPNPTEIPEFTPIEITEKEKTMKISLTIIRESMNKLLQQKREIKKIGLPKATQTEGNKKNNIENALEMMNNEKEIDLMKIRSKMVGLIEENEKAMEKLIKANGLCAEMERKNGENDFELTKVRAAANEYREKCLLLEKNNSFLQESLEKSNADRRKLKKLVKSLTNLLKKKQKDLQKALDNLYTTQVMWKVAEKKLKDIEKTWELSIGKKFVHKDINIDMIMKKSGIQKVQLDSIDNEIHESVKGEIDFSQVLFEKTIIDLKENEIGQENLSTSRKSKKKNENYIKFKDSRASSRVSVNNSELSDHFAEPVSPRRRIAAKKQKKIEKIKQKKKKNEGNVEKIKGNQAIDYLGLPCEDENDEQFSIISMKVPEKKRKRAEYELKNEDKEDNTDLGNHEKTFEGKLEERTIEKQSKKIEKDQNILGKEQSKLLEKEQNKILEKEKKKVQEKTHNKKPENTHKIALNSESPIEKPIEKNQKSPTAKESFTFSQMAKLNLSNNSLPRPEELARFPETSPLSNPQKTVFLEEPQKIKSLESHDVSTEIMLTPKVLNTNLETIQKISSKSTYKDPKQSSNLETPKKNIQKNDSFHIKPQLNHPSIKPITTSNYSNITPTPELKKDFQEIFASPRSNNIQNLSFSSNDKESMNKMHNLEKFISELQQTENGWMSTLSEEQQKSYSVYKEKAEDFKKFNAENCSKYVQCLLLNDNLGNYQLEGLMNQTEVRDLVSKVFANPAELYALPLKLQMELAKSLKGHEKLLCSEMCMHLQRVINFKRKYKGKLYPVKVIKM